ncbi:hypothetical protein [Saccharopolyspora hattusasensis]|uniref:hypothetical protein n=1 Tax=Saccharopolyspora hattusasensis TaxID=1128679 RepID=UPI003D96EF3C
MAENAAPRTRLEQLLHQRHMTIEDLIRKFHAMSEALSERQAYRWAAGEVRRLPYPHSQAALEKVFGEPAQRLLGPPYGIDAITVSHGSPAVQHGTDRSDWQGRLLSIAAERAREFLSRTDACEQLTSPRQA